MVEEYRVHGFPHRIIAPEGERYIADPAAYAHLRIIFLYPFSSFEEIQGIAPVLIKPRSYRENVQVENDIGRFEFNHIDQDIIRSLHDLQSAGVIVGLSQLIKSHDDNRCTITLHQLCLADEGFFTLFKADGIDDCFTLQYLQTRLQDFPFGAVDHDRDTGNVGFGSNQVQEMYHSRLAIQQTVIHIYIQYLCATFYLVAGNIQCFGIFSLFDQAQKLLGARYICAFSYIDKITFRGNDQGFQPT
ncbi:hypothetical protein D9M68_567660 [compost metagenome]